MKLAFAFALLLAVAPTRADSIGLGGDVNYIDFVNGTVPGPIADVEMFQTSFDYDTVSRQVSDMSFSASGLLGKHFTFSGVSITPLQGTSVFDTDFFWSNRQAIIDLTVPSEDFPTAQSPDFFGIEGTKPFILDCLTDRCQDDFGPRGFDPSIDSQGLADATFLGPSPSLTPTPESSSLSLLGLGLVGVGLLLRRRRRRSSAKV